MLAISNDDNDMDYVKGNLGLKTKLPVSRHYVIQGVASQKPWKYKLDLWEHW